MIQPNITPTIRSRCVSPPHKPTAAPRHTRDDTRNGTQRVSQALAQSGAALTRVCMCARLYQRSVCVYVTSVCCLLGRCARVRLSASMSTALRRQTLLAAHQTERQTRPLSSILTQAAAVNIFTCRSIRVCVRGFY